MSKAFGLFILKYTKPLLDLELQALVICYLRSTQLEYILGKYTDKNWNYYYLSKNPNIIIENVLGCDIPWNYHWLSDNPNITMKILLNNSDKNGI